MKIKILSSTQAQGEVLEEGKVYDIADSYARELIAFKLAEAASEELPAAEEAPRQTRKTKTTE